MRTKGKLWLGKSLRATAMVDEFEACLMRSIVNKIHLPEHPRISKSFNTAGTNNN